MLHPPKRTVSPHSLSFPRRRRSSSSLASTSRNGAVSIDRVVAIMDAVEVSYPLDVSGPGFAGSEGFGGRDRDTAAACDSSIKRCSSLATENGGTSGLESASWDKVSRIEHCRHSREQSNFSGGDAPKQLLPYRNGSNVPLWIPKVEEVQVQRRAGKVSRNSSGGCSKRPRISHLEDSAGPAGAQESSDKLGSHDKTQLGKPRNSVGSKRGDRRNGKVSMKAKYDSFSVKAGLATFNSVAGGSSFLGLYGLKTDVRDITNLVDDLSLNELLDGTYKCPSLGKEKGKTAANTSENVLHSVRKACSILQPCRPAQLQSSAELDSCSNEKPPGCPSNPVSIVANADSSPVNLSSSDKDSCSKPESPTDPLDFSIEHPKETLERLALPPPKDLETLLLDAAKPAVSSKHAPDPRPSKQTARRTVLQPFPWSHAFGGHCRANSDASKLLNRTTCQGRWARISYAASSLGTMTDSFTDLESLVYDENLVPSFAQKLDILENDGASSTSRPCFEQSFPQAAGSTTSHIPLESGGELKCQVKVEHCPMLLAAAQTLCDMATHLSRPNQDGMMRWPKKLSQKAMKARKAKSDEKPFEEIFAESSLLLGSNSVLRSGIDQLLPSKRPKVSTIETKRDIGLNGVRKGSLNWSTPKSSRSSPNKSVGDAMTETTHAASYMVKQSCMMPPPAKVLNRTCNGQPKGRRLMRMDWNR
ncbi:hypothetical protein Tsubulata_037355 [Turnera subulata]|uniref:Uncharacterized protein n=1 Tax=Turnera subulata TaxID=218843 RepID=A0A9Q0J2P9_9ROSI|nr:hypothetical protein Tsubulata_037355 [Turnera subulata]